MVNDWSGVPQEEEKDEAVLTDEDIAALQPIAEQAQEDYDDYKKDKAKRITATKERLMRRKDTPHEIEIDVGGEILVFKVKRMSESQRVKFNKLNLAKFGGDLESLSLEEIEQLRDQSYRLMAAMVIEPKMTLEEWKEYVDVALLDLLSNKVALLSTTVNDAVLIEEFKKK